MLDLSQFKDNETICVEDAEFSKTKKAAKIIVKEEVDLLASFDFFHTHEGGLFKNDDKKQMEADEQALESD